MDCRRPRRSQWRWEGGYLAAQFEWRLRRLDYERLDNRVLWLFDLSRQHDRPRLLFPMDCRRSRRFQRGWDGGYLVPQYKWHVRRLGYERLDDRVRWLFDLSRQDSRS